MIFVFCFYFNSVQTTSGGNLADGQEADRESQRTWKGWNGKKEAGRFGKTETGYHWNYSHIHIDAHSNGEGEREYNVDHLTGKFSKNLFLKFQ